MPTHEPELVIFDADGTLRYVTTPTHQYPRHAGEWKLMPRVRETFEKLSLWNRKLGIASNQPGVALGILSRQQAEDLIRQTVQLACGREPNFLRIEMCVCAPETPCPRRKPAPGMLLALLGHYQVAPQHALFVGDLPIDQHAAALAGIPFCFAQQFFTAGAGTR